MINVLAEAILAEWTGTPLPTSQAIRSRTRALVRAAGWEVRRRTKSYPNLVTTAVEIAHPLEPRHLKHVDELPAPFRHMARKKLEILKSTELQPLVVWLTESECNLLGRPTNEFQQLRRICRGGHLGHLDCRAVLVPWADPSELAAVDRLRINEMHLHLPNWAVWESSTEKRLPLAAILEWEQGLGKSRKFKDKREHRRIASN
jgi:hypothetical protein